MRIEWQVAVFCTLSCCFCGLINRKRESWLDRWIVRHFWPELVLPHLFGSLAKMISNVTRNMQLLTSLLTVIATISGNSQEKKRRKTNVLSTQQITLPEEGESRDEWNPARTGCQEHQARLLQIWKKKSRINENYRSSCIRLVAIFEKV